MSSQGRETLPQAPLASPAGGSGVAGGGSGTAGGGSGVAAGPAARVPSVAARLGSSLGRRAWWTAAAVTLLLWSYELLAWAGAYGLVTVLMVVATGWSVLTFAVVWSTRAPRWLARTAVWGTVVLCLACFGAWAVLQVYQAPGYGTDEIAFDQYAAHLLAHGTNPYTRSMAPAFPLYHVQPDGYTYRLNGTAVTTLSYPALSFLVYVPFLLLGLSSQLAVTVNVVAWMVAIVVTMALLPTSIRPLGLVVGSLSVYTGFAVGGVTVALYVPLLVGAVVAWHRWPGRRGWRAWISPALMGLALCVNQVPWFVLPFIVVGVGVEASRSGGRRAGWPAALRYLAISVGVAAVPNIPFVVWDAGAWLKGVLTPITTSSVPAGQGIVDLSLYLDLGGGYLKLLTVVSALALVALLVAFAAFYRRLRPLAVILPAIALLLATRSYASYVFGLVPAAVVAAVSTFHEAPLPLPGALPGGAEEPWSGRADDAAPRRHRSRLKVTATALALATVAAGVAAVVIPSPLTLRIEGVTTTGQLATVDQISIAVHNRSSRAVTPHFTVSSGGTVTTFWLIGSGPARLGPGRSATYDLMSPNFYAQPAIGSGFQVVAFTTSPASVSHSATYQPTTDHVDLTPDAINTVVPVGEQVVLKAQLLDEADRPIHRAGVVVYLGQIVYAQQGLEYGEAIINDGQPGQTPVSALTDSEGVATFDITGTHAGTDPVYFEANLVNDQHFYPYGYSQIVPIRFGG